MPLTPDRRLQLRIAAALTLVVGVNGLLLSVLAWSAIRVLVVSGQSPAIEVDLPLAVGAICCGAVGLVAVQAWYGSRTVVSGLTLEELEGDGPRGINGRVRRLASQADIPSPSVAIADRMEPACLTVGSQRSPTIVVTTGLLEALNDDELEAALAHEVAHIVNRDLPVVTAIAAMVSVGDRLLERERQFRAVLSGLVAVALFTGVGLLILALPLLVLGVVYLIVSAVARLLLAVNAITLGLFAKTREYAADRAGSELTGNPAALATALETLEDARKRPTQDARVHASATLGIVAQSLSVEPAAADDEKTWFEMWFVDQFALERVSHGASDTTGFLNRLSERGRTWFKRTVLTPVGNSIRRVLTWRPPTHPETEARIERLRVHNRRS